MSRPGKQRFLYSLRSRLIMLTLGITLVSILCVTWAAMMLVSRHLDQSIQQHLDNDIALAGLLHQNACGQLQAAIHSISLDNTIKTTMHLGISSQLQSQLDLLITQHGLDFLLVTDGMGNLQVSAKAGFSPGTDLYYHPVFFAGMLQNGASGTVLEQEPIILYQLESNNTKIIGQPVLVIESAQPIHYHDQMIGMVMGGRMISSNSELLRKIDRVVSSDPVLFMAGNQVAAATDSRNPGIAAGATLQLQLDFTQNGSDYRQLHGGNTVGEQFVYQYSPLPALDDTPFAAIVCFQDKQVFSNLLFRLQRLILSIAGAALLLAFFLSLWLSRSIAAPLRRMGNAMQHLREQEAVSLLPTDRQDEIGTLFRGYNRMATAIDQRIMDLAREISIRRKIEQDLAQESDRLQVTLHSLAEAVIATDNRGAVVLVNQAACTLLDRPKEQLLHQPVSGLFSFSARQSATPVPHPVMALLKSGKAEKPGGDLQLCLPDGRQLLVTQSCALLQTEGGRINGAVLVLLDVSERRKMEEELAKGLKLESVGVLAGGLAHDFNNLLTAILGNVSLAKMGAGDNKILRGNLEEAEKACLRAADLTKQLLTFSKGGAPVRKAVSLDKIIEETVSFVCRGSKVRPRFTIDDQLWLADADSGQIGQVLDNLVINAIQAMPGGGEITVTASNLTILNETVLPLQPGRYIRIAVADQGTGILQEDIDRIFDPYYTTKDFGSGLGLTISYAIVHKHGGHMTVDSIAGSGTTFSFYLPAAQPGVEVQGEVPENEPSGTITQSRLLLMDDEIMIRNAVGAMLERFGYEVTHASDGREAIALYRKHLGTNQAFHAVILDLTIPGGLGGEETIQKLRDMDPEVRAIVSSGYADHPVMAEYRKHGFRAVVAKPFRIDELAAVLHGVIHGRLQ